MPTDLELNARVAVKVMGWRLIRHEASTHHGSHWTKDWYDAHIPDPDGRNGRFWSAPHDEYPRPRAASSWSPATDIAAAWLVVEKMSEGDWELRLDRGGVAAVLVPLEKKAWRAAFLRRNEDGWSEEHLTTNASVARALCLAALEAVGEEQSDE